MPVRIAGLLAVIVASIAPQGVAADWADPAKVLRIAFPIDVSGLDPAGTQETYTTFEPGRLDRATDGGTLKRRRFYHRSR